MVVEISEGPPGGSKDGGNARDVLVRGSLARQIGDLSADLVARDHLVAVDVRSVLRVQRRWQCLEFARPRVCVVAMRPAECGPWAVCLRGSRREASQEWIEEGMESVQSR